MTLLTNDMPPVVTAAPPCPYCGSSGAGFVCAKIDWPDTLPFFKATYALHRCRSCDLIFAGPVERQTADGLERYFHESYNLSRGLDADALVARIWAKGDPLAGLRGVVRQFARTLRHSCRRPLPATPGRVAETLAILDAHGVDTLLDVGCSYGEFVAAARSRGFRAYGLEPTEDIVSLARRRGADCLHQGFFPDMHGPLPRYDALVFLYSLIYFTDVGPEVFRAMRERLNPGGVVVLFGIDDRCLEHAAGLDLLHDALVSPLVFNVVGETFLRRAAQDAGFAGYRRVSCFGEPGVAFQLLLA